MIDNEQRQKLHCAVDETGPDTEGAFFLVAVVILSEDVEESAACLPELIKGAGSKPARARERTGESVRPTPTLSGLA